METCEIVCIKGGFLGGKSYFVAKAAGSKGIYEAARSSKLFVAVDVFRMSKGGASEPVPVTNIPKEKEKAEAALNEIMQNLSSDGWQLDGKSGSEWWEYKYQRQSSQARTSTPSMGSSPSQTLWRELGIKSLDAVEEKNYQDAITYATQAIQLNATEGKLFSTRGYAYAKLNKLVEALDDFNRAIELDPNDAPSYLQRGNLYIEAELFDMALKEFNRSIQLDPNVPAPYLRRSVCYVKLNQLEKAKADLAHAKALWEGEN